MKFLPIFVAAIMLVTASDAEAGRKKRRKRRPEQQHADPDQRLVVRCRLIEARRELVHAQLNALHLACDLVAVVVAVLQGETYAVAIPLDAVAQPASATLAATTAQRNPRGQGGC